MYLKLPRFFWFVDLWFLYEKVRVGVFLNVDHIVGAAMGASNFLWVGARLSGNYNFVARFYRAFTGAVLLGEEVSQTIVICGKISGFASDVCCDKVAVAFAVAMTLSPIGVVTAPSYIISVIWD